MNWSGKRVLVTGAGGFIGGHLVQALVERGARLSAFLRYTSHGALGSLVFLPQSVREEIRVVHGDLKDGAAVFDAVRGNEVVFHLGALIGIPYSYVHPHDYVQTNVMGTAHVLDACRAHGVERLVHTSTSEVYGTARHVPIDEEHPLQPQSPYSASKIAADQLALSYHFTFDLPVAVLRPFNTYGPWQTSRAVIPTIVTQALRRKAVKLGALAPTRDLLFVEDTVSAFLRMAEVPAAVGQVVNVGTSRECSIGDLARKVFEQMGLDPVIEADEARQRPARSEVNRLLAATDKAQTLLNWSPTVGLDEGLRRTIAWIREHLDYYRVDAYHV